MQAVHHDKEQRSFMDRLAAVAQGAIHRLTGNGSTGGRLSRMAKLIPATMLAMFAWSSLQAQVYTTNFNTSSPAANITGSWSGGTTGTSVRCGSTGNGYYDVSGTSYTFNLQLTVAPGYQFTITDIESSIRKEVVSGSTATSQMQIIVNGGTATNIGSQASITTTNCTAFDRTVPNVNQGPYTSSDVVVIRWTGAFQSGNGFGIDDITVNGAVSPTCVMPVAQTVSNNGPLCGSAATATVSLGGSQTGVTYELRNSSNVMVSSVAGTGAAVSFPQQVGGGTYTVYAAYPSGPNAGCPNTNAGTTTIVTNPLPTATVTNGGEICYGETASFQINGTSGATVVYQLTGGSQQSVPLPVNGQHTVTHANATSNVTLTIISVTSSTCTNTTGSSSTVTVRPTPTAVFSGSSQLICEGSNYSGITVTTSTGSGNRTLYYSHRLNSGAWTSTNIAVTGTSVTLPVTFANPAAVGATYTFRLDSIRYNAAPNCTKENLTGTYTLSAKANPSFNFDMNGQILTAYNSSSAAAAGVGNAICLPSMAYFNVLNGPVGGTYTVLFNGTAFGSTGLLDNNGAGIVANVNAPGGIYKVTVTDNGCTTDKWYKVVEASAPTFAYYINGTQVTHGSTVYMCVGDNFKDSLVANNVRFSITSTGGASPFNQSTTTSAGPNWTSTNNNATAPGSHVVTLTVDDSNYSGSCGSSLQFNVVITAKPTYTVRYNGDVVSSNGTMNTCEGQNNTLTITGTPGDLVEIHYNYDVSLGSSFTQVQTGTIGVNGTYVWNNANGNVGTAYNAASDATTCSNVKRINYNIEVKTPGAFCSTTFNFNAKVNQKPLMRIGYDYTNNINTSLPGSGNGAVINNLDTVKLCYTSSSEIKFYFNWDAANVDSFVNKSGSTCTKVRNQVTFRLYKGAQIGGTQMFSGTINSTNPANTIVPVTAGSSGLYTLVFSNNAYNNGCETVKTFYVEASQAPVYTILQTGTSTIPGASATTATATVSTVNPVDFCQGSPKSITLKGIVGLNQTYTVTRVSGPGTAQNFNGNLTASDVVLTFNQLVPGVHSYRVAVTSTPGACPAYHTFQVKVTEMPRPVLKAVIGSDTITVTNGSTYTYCAGTIVHYFVQAPTSYSSTFGYVMNKVGISSPVATGTTVSTALETSVVTLDMQTVLNGAYTFKMTTLNSTSTCDSMITFNLQVNTPPNLTYVAHSASVNCYGDNSGWVRYHYNGTGNIFKTYIIKGGTDTVQTHTSNLQNQSNVIHSNLVAGNYTLVLVSDNGCPSSFTFTIGQPSAPVSVTISGTQAACNATNGTVTFGVNGGTHGYDVEIRNNATNVIATTFSQANPFSNYTVSNLAVGTYTVTVIDSKGCIGTASFTINNCSAPDLTPYAEFSNPNYSISHTTSLPFTVELYNVGQQVTSGTTTLYVMMPPGFSISSTGLPAGWVLTATGLYSTLTNTSLAVAPGGMVPAVLNLNIVGNGVGATGVFPVLVQIAPGSGGETNSANNVASSLLNVGN